VNLPSRVATGCAGRAMHEGHQGGQRQPGSDRSPFCFQI